MNAVTTPSSLIPLLYQQDKLTFIYPYMPSTYNLVPIYIWLKNNWNGLNTSYYLEVKKAQPTKISFVRWLRREHLFQRKNRLRLLKAIRSPDSLKYRSPKRLSSSLNDLTDLPIKTSEMWSEHYLTRLRGLRLLGFKPNSYAKRRLTPLSLELNPYRFVDETYSPLISKSSFTSQPIKSNRAQKLLRYLSLKRAHMALSDESWSGKIPKLFRKFFKPRSWTRRRQNRPNPYLFLGLKPFFKPVEVSPLERFIPKVRQYQTWASRESKLLTPLKGRFGNKRAGLLNRHRSFLRRKSLRFLKKYSLNHSFSSRRRIKKIPRKYPNVPHTLRNATPSIPYLADNLVFTCPKTDPLRQSQTTILSLRRQKYALHLKALITKPVRSQLNLWKIKYSHLLKKLAIKRTLLLLLVKLQKRSWFVNSFAKLYPLRLRHSNQKFKPKRRIRQPKVLLNIISRKSKTARKVQSITSLLGQLSKRTWGSIDALKPSSPDKLYRDASSTTPNLVNLPSWAILHKPTPSTVYDTINPTASIGFLRSPFFFTNFWINNRVGAFDVLNISKKSYTRHSYTIFPEANAMKTAVFRHLTSQRVLQQSRMASFHKKTTKSRFLSKVVSTTIPDSINNNSLYPSTSFPLSFTNILAMRHYLSFKVQKPMRYLRPKRIRFKPGYSRLWRVGRTSIKEILDIKAHYQYRLNPQLQTYYYQRRKLSKWLPVFTLEFALMKSHYAPDRDAVNSVLSVNGVFLNGTVVSNGKTTLFPNDFIQLIVNLKFYISLRWIRTWSLLRRNRTSKIFYRKYRPATFNKNIRVVRELPRWFFDIEFTAGDLPRYFEMDHFTLSIFVLPYHLTKDKLLPTRAYMFDARILNMYNWKYIT